jgi:LysR family transcriptional regulator of abg operon
MKLSHLRDILAVAEHGSLRAAGRHLGIAQPAITRSIREIEHELGVPLFERHAKGVRLTQMGDIFARRAATVQSELRRAREEIDQLKGEATGQVTVALSTASSIALLPRVMAAFRKRYPDALLKVSETLFHAAESEILEGKVDFYVGPLDEAAASAKFAVEKLFDNQRLVIARKDHPLRDATSMTDLADAQWVSPTLSTRGTEDNRGYDADINLEQMFERLGLPKPNVVMHARSALITMLAIADSDLLTVLPQQWLEYPATADRITGFAGIPPLRAPTICIARRLDVPLTPMAEYLCDLMSRAGANYSRH